jgi:hypothetical protein
MTHRDEWLALQARVEAQAREIDEARSEIALLRAAHAQKTREAEQLRRELRASQPELGERDPTQDDREGRSPFERSDHGEPPEGAVRRAFGAAAGVLAASAIFAAMLGATAASRGRARPIARAMHPMSAIAGVHLGRVVSDGAPELVAPGDTCTVEVTDVAAGPYDCRISVRCGEHTIYGATLDTGYVHCAGRAVVRDMNVTARDGDPAMELDIAARRVVVEEQLGLGTQRVEIELTPQASSISSADPAEH